MKFKIKHLLLLMVGALASCTDGFEEVNSDPNKIYDVKLSNILPGTVYRTMNALSDLNYNRLMSYSRYVTLTPFQNAWEGSDGLYRQFYVDILRDLKALEKKYANDEEHINSYDIVQTWEAYIYYQLLTLYGPVSLTDSDFDDNSKHSFKYDSEKTAYLILLDRLDKVVDTFNPESTEEITNDPVYSGDIEKWRKFANSLRLEMAMNMQNISEEESRKHAAKAMAHEDWIISSLDEAVCPHYGTVKDADGSWYYKQIYVNNIQNNNNWGLVPSMNEYFSVYLFTYNDPRMPVFFQESNATDPSAAPYTMPDVITRAHDCDVSNCSASDRTKHTQWMIEGKVVRDSLRVRYNIPYVPTPDGPGARTPFGWEIPFDPTDPNGNLRINDPLSKADIANNCFLQPRFYAINCDMPLFRWADACFLEAEAKVKFGLGRKSARQYYEDGIRASFTEYNILPQLDAYISQDGVAWGTSHKGLHDTRNLMNADINGANGTDGQLEQIYKQRYFADFLDCVSAWRLERRTRALNFPPFFYNGSQAYPEGGDPYYVYPERLCFGDGERTSNTAAYYAAIDTLQANSPKPKPESRWGDNVLTVLQFAKPVPDEEETISKWRSWVYVPYNMDMRSKYYGKNYEEFVVAARKKTGIMDDDEKALSEAFDFTITSVISVYVEDDNEEN